MMGVTHAAAGCLFAVALSPPTAALFGIDMQPEEVAIAAGIGVVAGLLPDIDHPNSMITAGVVPGSKFLGPLGRPIGWFLSIPPRIIGAGARTKLKHRGGTHSATFMMLWTALAAPLYALAFIAAAFVVSLIVGIIAAILPFVHDFSVLSFASWIFSNLPSAMPLIMIAVFWGYFSHLLTDSMTNVPVPWPWPFSKKRFSVLPKGMRITTDSFTEKALVRPIILLLLVLVVIFHILFPGGQKVLSNSGVVGQEIEKRVDKQKDKMKTKKEKREERKQEKKKEKKRELKKEKKKKERKQEKKKEKREERKKES